MSLYSNRVRTEYITAKFDRGLLRTVFELPEQSNFYSNVRLIDLGLEQPDATELGIFSSGLYGLISEIELSSKNTVISKITDFEQWSEWMMTNYPNDDALVNKYLSNNTVGYSFEDNKVCVRDVPANATKGVMLNLQNVIGYLRNVEVLSSVNMPQLKITVKYNPKAADLFGAINARYEDLTLALDVIKGGEEEVAATVPSSVSFVDVERELLFMPATTGTQVFKQRLKNFNGKSLKRVLVKKVLKDTNADNLVRSAGFGSIALVNEGFNISVNGSEVLPFSGLKNQPMEMLGYLTSSWGESSCFVGSNYTRIVGQDAQYLQELYLFDSADNKKYIEKQIGFQSYIGLSIMEKIKDLQITMSRDADPQTPAPPDGGYNLSSAVNVYVFGEVEKVVNVSNGSVLVSYE